jgi:hypothetical protein
MIRPIDWVLDIRSGRVWELLYHLSTVCATFSYTVLTWAVPTTCRTALGVVLLMWLRPCPDIILS